MIGLMVSLYDVCLTSLETGPKWITNAAKCCREDNLFNHKFDGFDVLNRNDKSHVCHFHQQVTKCLKWCKCYCSGTDCKQNLIGSSF